MLYRFSLSGIVHRGSVAGVSDYIARGEYAEERGLAVGAADYIAREGRYSDKAPPAWQGFFGPENAPERFRHVENAQANWYEACQAERQRNGQVAEHYIVNLAPELTLQQNIWMLQDHIRAYTRDGRVVQAAIHHEPDGDPRNIHTHLLVSTRRVDEHGFVAHKAKEQQARWAQRSRVMEGYRQDWENVGRRHLERHGHSTEGFDRRSYLRQGLDRIPGRHLSRAEIERDAEAIERHNRSIRELNAERQRQSLDKVVEQSHPDPTPARPTVTPEERAQLERDARADCMDSGDVATPADVARQISVAYRREEARLEAINKQLDRTAWNRGQLDQEAQASLARIDERREKMSWWETIKNIGRTDPELAHWRDVHDRSVIGYKQAARKERALEKEQAKATRDANKAYASVKPAAVAELNRRHVIANDAREKPRVLDAGERAVEKQPIDRAAEREQRATDFYERKIIAGRDLRRQAREERLQRGDDFWQQTLAAGRMARQATANTTTYEDVRRLNETAKLDRDKWGYHPLTVEDVAREISPTFADADARFKALTTKAENLDKAIEDKAHAEHGVKGQHDLRQEQMSGLQAVADRFWRDQQLFDLEETWHKLDKERIELVEHRTRLADKIGAAEDTFAAELEKIREPAQQELVDRQQRAAAARETLAAYRARERAIEQERQAERQRLQPSRGYSLGR